MPTDQPVDLPVQYYSLSRASASSDAIEEHLHVANPSCVDGCEASVGAVADTTYTLSLRAVSAQGPSTPSLELTVVTPASEPETVSVKNVTVNAKSISVSWVEPAANGAPVETYSVEVCDVQVRCCTTASPESRLNTRTPGPRTHQVVRQR